MERSTSYMDLSVSVECHNVVHLNTMCQLNCCSGEHAHLENNTVIKST